jgi:hypothetical protein
MHILSYHNIFADDRIGEEEEESCKPHFVSITKLMVITKLEHRDIESNVEKECPTIIEHIAPLSFFITVEVKLQ